MINDTISDMLTRIRNSNLARHQVVPVPSTKIIKNIVQVLKDEGFMCNFEEMQYASHSAILIYLKYKGPDRQPVITTLQRVSKPGLRVYANHKEIPRVLGGLGIAIISTSSGIITDRIARHNGIGGEVLVCFEKNYNNKFTQDLCINEMIYAY
uniref:Small ribosomal subunit protein uS8c n=1 Tax=Bulboplastis apyrenoidosa TaxID=1070855 RepID=A0A1Y9TMB1_9RHOD|nr:30S ribosomal protein S8 [Bulboplastis apyrenoidosa]ARO90771.1 30S ribosomal protein S8 [Bulboplastis apyrenoidosa]